MNKKEPHEENRVGYALIGLGILFSAFGLFSLYSFENDPTGMHLYSDGKTFFLGLLLICGGILTFFRAKPDDTFYKCTKCYETILKKEVNDIICPNCNGRLENLAGFFDRHPPKEE